MLQVNEGAIVPSNAVYKKRSRDRQRRGAVGLKWRRVKDNIDVLVDRAGANPEMGSEISRAVLFETLTRGEGMAARRYGEIVGAYERFWNVDQMKRSAASPSYMRGARGEDNELERRIAMGTIAEYERMSKRAKKRYERLQKVIAPYVHIEGMVTGARGWLDDLCCNDIPVPSAVMPSLAKVLRQIGIEFGDILPGAAAKPLPKGGKHVEVQRKRDANDVAQAAIDALTRHFEFNKKKVGGFRLTHENGVARISGVEQASSDDVQPMTHSIEISMKGLMAEEFTAAFLRAAERAEWRDEDLHQ
jgi:hypothetical protein